MRELLDLSTWLDRRIHTNNQIELIFRIKGVARTRYKIAGKITVNLRYPPNQGVTPRVEF